MSVERIGRYLIEKTLGRGAMGVVYLALDPLIDRRVALKTLRLDLDAEHVEEFRERFVREARAAGRLNHPGIVTIHDVGEDPESGLMYIAMEYVEGRDLKQLLAAGHRFRPSEAARIAAEVANALDYAHSLGVVHRDIKPANIVLTGNGTAKITDFGIAHLETSNLTVDGQFIGTPNFMSPEQVAGREVDGRSDLFSLGVVLFNLLTDRRPWGGNTMHEVTLRIVQEPCPIPSTLDDQIPTAFNPVVLKCLEKNPERRFQSGAELARVLAALARSLRSRSPEDPAGTLVAPAELGTRVVAASQAEPLPTVRQKVQRAWSAGRSRLAGIEPEWLTWPVQPRWAWSLIGAALVIGLVAVAGLRSQIDRGPFAAPSTASIRNLNAVVGSLQLAERELAAGDLAAAEKAVMAALDQAPTSAAGRRLVREIRRGFEAERTSAANQRRVDELVGEGRGLYRSGDYRGARDRFRGALELDPLHEIAASYLELAQERLRSSRPQPAGPAAATGPAAPGTVRPAAAAPVTSGIARITLHFDSPISSGTVAVSLNGEALAEVPFDFSTAGFLGLRKKGRGAVRRVLLTPAGEHRIGVELLHPTRGVLGSASFIRGLDPDSDWTLRVDLPSERAEPSFFLVQRAR